MAFYVKPRVPEMTYTVSGGTLNPTHSLTMSTTLQATAHAYVLSSLHRAGRGRRITFG